MSTKQTDSKDNKAKGSQKEETSSNSLINGALIVAIIVVVISSQQIKDSIVGWKAGIEHLSAPLSADPLKLDKPGKNPMCPSAVEDYESCLDKLQRCKDTEKEFKVAESGKGIQ